MPKRVMLRHVSPYAHTCYWGMMYANAIDMRTDVMDLGPQIEDLGPTQVIDMGKQGSSRRSIGINRGDQ
jgi:hypothetical protein